MESAIREIIVATDFSMRQSDRRPTGKLFRPDRRIVGSRHPLKGDRAATIAQIQVVSESWSTTRT